MYLIIMTRNEADSYYESSYAKYKEHKKIYVIPDNLVGMEVFLQDYIDWCTFEDNDNFDQVENKVTVYAINPENLVAQAKDATGLICGHHTCDFDGTPSFDEMNLLDSVPFIKEKMLEASAQKIKQLEEKRAHAHKIWQEQQLEKERQEYLKLKAKFEPEVK